MSKSLMHDIVYVDAINNLIRSFLQDDQFADSDRWTLRELLKVKSRDFSINHYSKQKKTKKRNALLIMMHYSPLKDLWLKIRNNSTI